MDQKRGVLEWELLKMRVKSVSKEDKQYLKGLGGEIGLEDY